MVSPMCIDSLQTTVLEGARELSPFRFLLLLLPHTLSLHTGGSANTSRLPPTPWGCSQPKSWQVCCWFFFFSKLITNTLISILFCDYVKLYFFFFLIWKGTISEGFFRLWSPSIKVTWSRNAVCAALLRIWK